MNLKEQRLPLPWFFPWELSEVTALPAGCKVLATSPACAVQAFSWETRAHAVQFHLEVEPDTVDNWAAIPEYAAALQGALGDNGVAKMKGWVDVEIGRFEDMAERVYINWMQTAAQAR